MTDFTTCISKMLHFFNCVIYSFLTPELVDDINDWLISAHCVCKQSDFLLEDEIGDIKIS